MTQTQVFVWQPSCKCAGWKKEWTHDTGHLHSWCTWIWRAAPPGRWCSCRRCPWPDDTAASVWCRRCWWSYCDPRSLPQMSPYPRGTPLQTCTDTHRTLSVCWLRSGWGRGLCLSLTSLAPPPQQRSSCCLRSRRCPWSSLRTAGTRTSADAPSASCPRYGFSLTHLDGKEDTVRNRKNTETDLRRDGTHRLTRCRIRWERISPR